jgi:hypothetical protein
VHILDEGIDIPECDSIYLTHPNNNPTSIIQRISRANRININNETKIAKIFLWTKDKLKLNNIISTISKIIKIKTYSFHENNSNNTKINICNDSNLINRFYIDKFNNNNNNITILFDDENKIWFGLRDIIYLLGYINYEKAIANIKITPSNKKEYCNINTKTKYHNMKPHTKFINEYGLHEVLFLSTKPIAKKILKDILYTITHNN